MNKYFLMDYFVEYLLDLYQSLVYKEVNDKTYKYTKTILCNRYVLQSSSNIERRTF